MKNQEDIGAMADALSDGIIKQGRKIGDAGAVEVAVSPASATGGVALVERLSRRRPYCR